MLDLPTRWKPLSESQLSAATATSNPVFAYQWLIETALLWIRWVQAPLPLLLIPLVPRLPWPLPVLVAVVDAGLRCLLSRPPDLARLRIVRRLATALEWLAVPSVIGSLVRTTVRLAPALLLVLSGARFGSRGVLGATVGAWVVIAALSGWRLYSAPGDCAAAHIGVRWAIVVRRPPTGRRSPYATPPARARTLGAAFARRPAAAHPNWYSSWLVGCATRSGSIGARWGDVPSLAQGVSLLTEGVNPPYQGVRGGETGVISPDDGPNAHDRLSGRYTRANG